MMYRSTLVQRLSLLLLFMAVYARQDTFAQGPAETMRSVPAAEPRPNTPGPSPQAIMRQRQFDIPFQVARTGTRPSEVHLYVSQDSGAQWLLAARQHPDSQLFSFIAPNDGTYWFATRTVDPAGNLHPSSPRIVPELTVLVDTTEPVMTVQAEADPAGTILLKFRISDAAPAVSQLQWMYLADSDRSEWITLPLDRSRLLSPAPGVIEGTLQFTPPRDWRYVQLRGTVTDQAGNEAVLNKQVERPRVAAGVPAQLASSPIGITERENAGRENAGRGDHGYSMSIPLPSGAPDNRIAESMIQPPSLSQGFPPTQLRAPDADSRAQLKAPGADSSALDATEPKMPSAPRTPASAMRPIEMETLPAPQGVPETSNPSTANLSPESANRETGGSQTLGSQSPGGFQGPESSRPPASLTPPPIDPDQARYSRVPRFELDYEIESMGAQGVSAIELWGTRDGGVSWSTWGRDEDQESPLDIETTGPGMYGFKIVVVGKNGLTSAMPQPGEGADLYVCVDLQAPRVHLTAARYGKDEEVGCLVIEYQCEDDYLAPRPISLAFSADANGPWTTFAAGLENTGRYAWPADPRLPRQIYLRIEAVDRAGNMGIETTPKPISVEGLAPAVRIRGFQPVANN